MKGKSIAIKRINKDMKEIIKSPIEGIGIVSLDNDPMKYVVNIKLMEGPYKNYCVQLLLTFPDTYPTIPPKILIYPNQAIDGQYHHHIFPDHTQDENGHFFKKFCFDLLDNDFMSTKEEKTGWNPSYSISSLLLQVQNFLCDPDMHGHIPDKNKIDQLMDSMNTYQRSFKIENEKGEQEVIVHTWSKPYPEMYIKKENEKKEEKKEEKDEKNDKNILKMQQIKENLTCFMLKTNYIDDPDILLGYPIIQTKSEYGKDKIDLYPIPELLTYDGFVAQIGKQDIKLDYYFDIKFKSANNQFYNCWLPIYIDENHYKKNRTAILNALSIIKHGAKGIEQYDFKPEYIFEVLPILLNKMIIGIFSGKVSISSAFIRCYFHYVLLFKKLCLEFEDEYCNYVNHVLTLIKKNNYEVNKQIIPDIGNFFMLLFFSNKDTHSEKMKKIWYALFEELSIRKIYWMFYSDDNRLTMKKLFFKDQKPSYDDICFKRFEEDYYYDIVNFSQFNEELKKNKIFDKIVDIINNDENFKEIRITSYFSYDYSDDEDYFECQTLTDTKEKKEHIQQKMETSFKNLYMQCSKFTRKKLYGIISQKMQFSNYCDPKEKEETVKLFEDKTEIRNNYYDSCNLDEYLKDKKINNIDEILKYAFDSQKGNKLLIITFLTQTKIENKEFMKELEENYGIYLDVDSFIKEMNQKLTEIRSISEMYKFLGSEFGKDLTDLEIIINSYKKAKLRGNIRGVFPSDSNKSNNFRGGNNRGRGRGDFRGNRGGRGGRGTGRGRGKRGGH